MSFTILKEEEFTSFIEKCKEHSFMQTVSMSNLLRKRGFETKFLGWKSNNETTVAAIAFMKHLTGGVRIEINSGPSVYDGPLLISILTGGVRIEINSGPSYTDESD